MHSGADLLAFQAALNKDIEGDVSASQPSDSDTGILLNLLFLIHITKLTLIIDPLQITLWNLVRTINFGNYITLVFFICLIWESTSLWMQ